MSTDEISGRGVIQAALVRASGLSWMVDRIVELRGQGERAEPWLEWMAREGGVECMSFAVKRENGLFEWPPVEGAPPQHRQFHVIVQRANGQVEDPGVFDDPSSGIDPGGLRF